MSQHFFRMNDRYRFEGAERFDKWVAGEFLIGEPYGCQVVISNPTSTRQRLDLLLQIPRGAVPILNGRPTEAETVDLQPYATQAFEYHFYFPADGEFGHFPVHAGREGRLIAWVEPEPVRAVERLSAVDTTTWDYVSQNGTEDDVIAYLDDQNLGRVDLTRVAWRMRDADFFRRAIATLERRHAWDATLWSYAIAHDEPAAIREFLQHREGFVAQSGAFIESPLLTIDPVARHAWQQLEYSPLVNARAHQLGSGRRILNDRFREQYLATMNVLAYRPALDSSDWLAVTTYLLLQDRIDEALDAFARVEPEAVASRIQYDYLHATLCFYEEDMPGARRIAEAYADYPVDRWRDLFLAVGAQLDEIEGAQNAAVDGDDRDQTQTALAATEPSFDFKVESQAITIDYQNLSEVTVNYYLMDLELLFSRNPFVQASGGRFSTVRPDASERRELYAGDRTMTFALPERYHGANVMVEVAAAGVRKAQAYYAHSLAVQVTESYGQARVANAASGRPLGRVYVKVYARMSGGQVRFYKDGYTDLRGRFDYGSLNTNELERVERFAMLFVSPEDGAIIREAAPPGR